MRAAVEILLVLLLVVANGVFSMSETSIVSSRKARLQQRAEAGDEKARAALALADEPNTFLATVQVGITLIGILSGAFGGAALAQTLGRGLSSVAPPLAPYAGAVSLILVVALITYLSLVIGELAPKRIALNNPEAIASRVAGPMRRLSTLTSPVVRLLGWSTDRVLTLLGVRESGEPPVTEEEIGVLLEQGARAGVFDPVEQQMVDSVFELADLRVAALMTPRTEVVWLDLDDPAETNRRKIARSEYSRFPVGRGSLDGVIGVVRAKDLLLGPLTGHALDLHESLRPPLIVPETMPALHVLEKFRTSRAHLALVVDEYGGVVGLVTLQDVLEAIVGDLPSGGESSDPEALQREDGSWLLDGSLPTARFKDILGLQRHPQEQEDGYQTLGGFVLARLGEIPSAGDNFEWADWRFEVADMDGYRVDKVLATPAGGPET
jgi:putative hemolysin